MRTLLALPRFRGPASGCTTHDDDDDDDDDDSSRLYSELLHGQMSETRKREN